MYYRFIFCLILGLLTSTIQAQDLRMKKKASTGLWGYQDYRGKWIIPPMYEDANAFFHGIASVKHNGKYGYINAQNRIVVDFIYDYAYSIGADGHAAVIIDGQEKRIRVFNPKIPTSSASPILPFSTFAKQYVESKINTWQQKGRYEKTIDWQKRVNINTRDAKIAALTQEAEQLYLKQKNKPTLFMKIQNYDADNEVFLIESSYGQLLVPVPIKRAPMFEKLWDRIIKEPRYFIENDYPALSEVKFTMPDGDVYKYSNQASLNYVAADIDYQFDPIEIEVPGSPSSKGTQTISKNNITVGRSDVDLNIPLVSRHNENTFAVIIANENYQQEANVPFAHNDGQTFSEYCTKTLGIPSKNVHLVLDATLNNIRGEVGWMNRVARAYDGHAKFIFYYAGHGIPDERTKDAYLLPTDGYGSDVLTGYKIERLYEQLANLPAESVLVFMDACFSGSQRGDAMLASTRGVAIKTKSEIPEGRIVVFSAAQGDETAYPLMDKGHGTFTYYLLKKLQLTKGNVSLGELTDYVTQQVERAVVTNRKSQTPMVSPSAAMGKKWRELKM